MHNSGHPNCIVICPSSPGRSDVATIAFHWKDANQTLAIDKRVGSFPGMLQKRTFSIVSWEKARHRRRTPRSAGGSLSCEGKKQVVRFLM